MASGGLPGSAVIARLSVALAVAMLCLCSCAAPRSTAKPLVVPTSGPVKISAQWLRTLPGESIDGFSFHQFGANGLPTHAWDGLEITGGLNQSGADFTVVSTGTAADDIYLYVTYDGASFALDEANPDSSRQDEYLFLAVPHRITDVLAIGMARIGSQRGNPAPAGPLAQLHFTKGSERVYRSISEVNADPRSVVDLVVVANGPDWIDLTWKERNIGDYNNNGLVEVSDLTPVGFYYEQQVSSAADPQAAHVADGNLDGYITVADLTPIGSNYLRSIEGYSVYRSAGPISDLDSYMPFGLPTIPRREVYEATPVELRRHQLSYSYRAPVETGENYYFVRAVSTDGPVVFEGPGSNIVEATGGTGNQQPYWENTVGLTGAFGSGDGIAMRFGRALDIEDISVEYLLRYVTADLEIGFPGTVEVVIPPGVTTGDPPYNWELTGLARGETYKLLLTARDQEYLETSNIDITTAKVPDIGVSSDTWPYHRRDPGRTGSNPGSTLLEPLTEAWSLDISQGGEYSAISQPVISTDGYVMAIDRPGGLNRIRLTDSLDVTTYIPFGTGGPYYLALDSPSLTASASDMLAVFGLGGSSSISSVALDSITAPLLLGDYVYTASLDGEIFCNLWVNGNEEWCFTSGESLTYSTHLVADEEYIYAISDTGRIDKLDLLTGESVFHAELAGSITGGGVALDEINDLLYYSTADTWLTEIELDGFTVTRTWDDPGTADPSRSAPALALGHTPRLAFIADNANGLYAANLDTGGREWLAEITPQAPLEPYRTAVTCSQQRIYVTSSQFAPYCFDYSGNLRQQLSVPGLPQSGFIIGNGHGAYIAGGRLYVFETAEDDDSPVWQGHAGVRELVPGDSRVEVRWDHAVDDHGEPVFYTIYYRAGQPPELSAPYTGTTLVTAIPHTGATHAQWIEGLVNGTRYYFAVRAYDGLWNESPNIDQNTEVLACTPPWQRVELVLGAELPGGEVYSLRGLVSGDDELHLVYNDGTDGHLVHAWGSFPQGNPAAATWQHEGSGLAAYSAAGFEPAFDPLAGEIVIGWAADGEVGTLARTGPDTWDKDVFIEVTPGINPQVSLWFGAEAAFSYTEHIELGPVENHIDYYLKRTAGGVWQLYEPLEETNLSGRDIDLVLSPADGSSPQAALQRGGESTPNRHTPQEGECMYAWWDELGDAFTYDTVDAGDNAPESDCGKRVQQVLDGDGHPHLTYLDLNASATEPVGQLKYAYHDGAAWHVETVDTLDLSFQTASLQFTYGELGLALASDGLGGERPVITILDRQSGSTTGQPHLAIALVWFREGADDWRSEQLIDAEWVFPRDREPCQLLMTRDGVSGLEYLNVFYVTTTDQLTAPSADLIVHYWREWNP